MPFEVKYSKALPGVHELNVAKANYSVDQGYEAIGKGIEKLGAGMMKMGKSWKEADDTAAMSEDQRADTEDYADTERRTESIGKTPASDEDSVVFGVFSLTGDKS